MSATFPSFPAFPADPWHRHERSCYWDHTRCGWVCASAPQATAPVVEAGPVALPEPVPVLVPEPTSRTAL